MTMLAALLEDPKPGLATDSITLLTVAFIRMLLSAWTTTSPETSTAVSSM
jgi:hypothetical protein